MEHIWWSKKSPGQKLRSKIRHTLFHYLIATLYILYKYIHDHGIDGGYDFPLLHGEVEDNAVQHNPGNTNGSVQEPGFLKRMATVRIVLWHGQIILGWSFGANYFYFSLCLNSFRAVRWLSVHLSLRKKNRCSFKMSEVEIIGLLIWKLSTSIWNCSRYIFRQPLSEL